MKISPNAPCPCGSGAKLKRCCGLAHRGRPVDPPRLMRSRYTAYALGDARYLMETTHPECPQFRTDRAAWRKELVAYCRGTRFVGLVVHGAEVDGDEAWVAFTARMTRDGLDLGFSERSLFRRVDGRWLYVSGEVEDL